MKINKIFKQKKIENCSCDVENLFFTKVVVVGYERMKTMV